MRDTPASGDVDFGEVEALIDAALEAQRVVGVTDWRAPYYFAVAMKRDVAKSDLLTAIRSLVSQAREQGIEEAAKVADGFLCGACRHYGEHTAAIRALKNTTPTRSDAGNEGGTA